MSSDVQLLGISNAIVDVLAHVKPDFLDKLGAVPGSMTLVDEQRAHEIYDLMGPATEMSGGSVANSVAGFALLGGSAAYIGKVRKDQLGDIFNHDMRALGVDIRLPPAEDGAPTARSHVLITEDGQRTMQTYLGACTELAVADVTETTVRSPKVTLLEGYLWDIAEGPSLARQAIDIARRNGTTVALSLSDSFCVERHQASFAAAVADGVDIVLADEDEINMLLGTRDIDATLAALEGRDNLFVITRADKGSVVYQRGEIVTQAADAVDKVVDTTGAGDAYTAGFLYGWAEGWSLADAARLGTHSATNVIQRVGARIDAGLMDSFTR
ncbi:MAG: adenosine kinase [Pseudomonadota bacterium]